MSHYVVISFKEDVYAIETILSIDEIEENFIEEPLRENWTVWGLMENTTEAEADAFASSLQEEKEAEEAEITVYGPTYIQSDVSGWEEII